MDNVEVDLKGRHFVFDPESTEVHLYRCYEDSLFNHVEAVEYESQRVYLFDNPKAVMFLGGLAVPCGMSDKELDQITSAMDEKYGWNAKVIIADKAPEAIKERYIKMATVAMQNDIVFIPENWKVI